LRRPVAGKVVLFIAAESREFSGIVRTVQTRPLDWGLRFACEGDLNGSRILMVADGPGMQLAGAATDTVRRHVRPDAVVSTGFCGALEPDLKPGDVVVASSVIDKENKDTYEAVEPQCGVAAERGSVLSCNRVAGSVSERAALQLTGALAVEMEAAAVAARARVWDVPFYCVRSVSDAADEDFPIDFNEVRDSNGRFSRSRIIAATALKPWSRIPFLLKLDRNCRVASERLGEFFANCRF
jgi:adenosylhomocysteine nucleosidase